MTHLGSVLSWSRCVCVCCVCVCVCVCVCTCVCCAKKLGKLRNLCAKFVVCDSKFILFTQDVNVPPWHFAVSVYVSNVSFYHPRLLFSLLILCS